MYKRSPYVEAIITRLSRQEGPIGQSKVRGIVNTTEIHRVCDRIRELLKDRANVQLEGDWLALIRYTMLNRRFTVAEANRVHTIYSQYKYLRVRPETKKGKR